MSDNEERWVEDNGSWYHYYSNGEMATGWQEIDGESYYFYDDGSMAWDTMVNGYYVNHDGQWTKDEGSRKITDNDGNDFWYYVGPKGKAVTGWNKIGDSFHYYNYPGGSMTRDNTIDGFYIDNDGNIAGGTGWLKDEYSGNWYYYSDGENASGWKQIDGSWYYFFSDGQMVTSWFNKDGSWYYFHSDGSMATGWVKDENGWYFLDNDGSMKRDYTDDGYHVDSSGKMVTGTGWVPSDGSWYYLKDDGSVATGWLYDEGNWYFLYPQGSMAHDTTVDGYYLYDNGAWIPDWVPENLNSTQNTAKELLDNPTAVSLTQSDATKKIFAAVNFEKDENGVYHTSQPDCWQYPGGYCDFYDYIFDKAASMDKLKYPFKVGNTEYIIWMWKGDYLNLGAGGEVGIYDNKHSIPSMNIGEISTPAIDNIPGLDEVSKDNSLNMTLHASLDGVTTIFDWDPGKPNWWVTGWNPKFQNIAQENIVLSGTIDFSGHDDLWEAFSSEYKEDEHLTFHPDTHIVEFKWQ